MKVRRDFVTNSSSSSFILTFKDEDSIYNTLKEQFPKDIEPGWSAGDTGYFHQLLNEIDETKRLTKEELDEIINDENYYIKWKIINDLQIKNNMSYHEADEYLKTELGKKMYEEQLENWVQEIYEKIGDNKIIVEVEHGDGGEGEDGVLEHDILPYLDCTVVRFSHH